MQKFRTTWTKLNLVHAFDLKVSVTSPVLFSRTAFK